MTQRTITVTLDDRMEAYLHDLACRDGRDWQLERAAEVVLQVAIEDRLDRESGFLRDHVGPRLLKAAEVALV